MCLKNYSSLIDNCYNYLGYKKGVRDEKVTLLIEKSLKEIESLSQFKYIYQKYDYIIDELKKEPYLSFLEGANEYFIGAMTLGYNVERRIKMYSKSDMEYMVIFDACASAYLEYMSDMFEKTIYENPSYRFCPGYGGSKASDIFLIQDVLNP